MTHFERTLHFGAAFGVLYARLWNGWGYGLAFFWALHLSAQNRAIEVTIAIAIVINIAMKFLIENDFFNTARLWSQKNQAWD